jgi:putative endonuclease
LEKKLRGWSRKKKEALINGDYDMLHTLAECRNATHYRYRPSAALGPPTS